MGKIQHDCWRCYCGSVYSIQKDVIETEKDRVILSRRGDPGIFVANRASLPQRGQLTVRANFHRAPVELPPAINN